MPLTTHQKAVLSYIGEFQHKRGYSPSLSDLALAFGVRSKNAMAKVVNVLEHENVLHKDPKGRIKILERETQNKKQENPLLLPLFGPIPAGPAATAEEHAEETISLSDYLVTKPSSTFLLRVKGDSMIGAGIFDEDLVVVDKNAEPKSEDIVVGILDGAFTLKRLRKVKGTYYFQAENPAYRDLHPREELAVAGVVKGVIRRY